MRSAQRMRNSSRKKEFNFLMEDDDDDTSKMRCKFCGRGVIRSNFLIEARSAGEDDTFVDRHLLVILLAVGNWYACHRRNDLDTRTIMFMTT